MKLSTIYGLAAATAIAVSGVALMAINGPASAAPRHASVNYCLQYGNGGSDCSFTRKAQCRPTAARQQAACFRNYYGKQGGTPHRAAKPSLGGARLTPSGF